MSKVNALPRGGLSAFITARRVSGIGQGMVSKVLFLACLSALPGLAQRLTYT